MIRSRDFSEYIATIDDLSAQFSQDVQDFVMAYGDVLAEVSVDLGDMFDAADYPSQMDVRAKFKFESEIEVIPDRANTTPDPDSARIEKL